MVDAPTFDSGEVPPSTKLNQMRDSVRDAQNPPGVQIRRNAVQLIANSTFTNIEYDQEAFDNAAMWTSAAATAVVLPVSALYVAVAWSEFAANATGIRVQQINLDGNRVDDDSPNTTTSAAAHRMTTAASFAAVAGSVVTVQLWQNSGTGLNATARLGVFRSTGPVAVFSVF